MAHNQRVYLSSNLYTKVSPDGASSVSFGLRPVSWSEWIKHHDIVEQESLLYVVAPEAGITGSVADNDDKAFQLMRRNVGTLGLFNLTLESGEALWIRWDGNEEVPVEKRFCSVR